MAVMSVVAHRIIARKRAAVDVLLTPRLDKEFHVNGQAFLDQSRSSSGLNAMLNPTDETGFKNQFKIQTYLNALELVCVSICNHVIDETVCKDQIGDLITGRWELSKNLTTEIRRIKSDNVYKYLQKVSEAWEADEFVTKENNQATNFIKTLKETFWAG